MHNVQSNTFPNQDKDSATEHASTHQDFHWIGASERQHPHASFIESALDISVGIQACLQIIYASDLERAANEDADPGDTAPPAIGSVQADRLMRLSIASAGLLGDAARRQVDLINSP